MNDPDYDPTEKRPYECFNCGTVRRAANPRTCPDCGAEMRNRLLPLE